MSSYGPYRVVRRIGAGGMGEVFLAEHELIGRKAAIKVLRADRSERESVDRFFNEARAAAVISDPGIVQIYDFGFLPDGTGYIVMENLDGEPLSDRLKRLGALPVVDALRIVRQAAGSLAAAHAAGIVHRDLKPDNLFMVRDPEAAGGERPKILDFGIAKLEFDANRYKTKSGAVMGTPIYMSPEQCSDAAAVDHRSDIYSLGCVLFHLLTGRPPFERDGLPALISAHVNQAPQPPSALVSQQLPRNIDWITLRCLAKKPEDRFSSMNELQQACDAAMRESANLAPMPFAATQAAPSATPATAVTTLREAVGQSVSKPPRRSSRSIVIGIAAAVVVLAGVGFAVVAAGGGGESRATVEPAKPNDPPKPTIEPPKTEPPPKAETKTEPSSKTEPPNEPSSKTEPPPKTEPSKTDAKVPKTDPPPKADPTKPKPKPQPQPKPRPRPQVPNDLYDDRN